MRIHDDAQIGSGAKLTGDVKIKSGVKIGCNSRLRGDIVVRRNSILKRRTHLSGDVSIGRGSVINERAEFLGDIGDIKVGNFCAIAPDTVFQAHNHDTSRASQQVIFNNEIINSQMELIDDGGITFGSDIWTGKNSIILPGVEIGHGAIIGAGSVVTKHVEPYSVVGGVPATHIKWRFSKNIRNKLLNLRWWEWEFDKIINNKRFFEFDLKKLNKEGRLNIAFDSIVP
jgi:virginiamycin A acetyltransferase